MKYSRLAVFPATVSVILLANCSTEKQPSEQPPGTSSASTALSIRQTDDNGVALPFETDFPERWNSSNDGTPYEPCTAISQVDAESAGLDPTSVADAAAVSGQTLRGCRWIFVGSGATGWSADQVVADFESLDEYKKDNSDFDWFDDVSVDGRTVGVASATGRNCFTYVQSKSSGVTTGVMFIGTDRPPLTEICQRAIDLTKATIDKIPE